MSVVKQLNELKALIEGASDDAAKTDGGNTAASTRVRKVMQDVKAAAKEIRDAALAARNKPAEKTKKSKK